MLPSGHVEITWGILNLVQRRLRAFAHADYRLVALAAVLPDLIDKPLAVFAFPKTKATLLYAHTLLAHLGAWGAAAASGQLRRTLPYLLAFSGHLLLDRIWRFPRTLFYPFQGRRFHAWRDMSSPLLFWKGYLTALWQYPYLSIAEVVGVVALAWLVRDRGLHQRGTLARFLRTGHVAGDNDSTFREDL
ncbi:MAG: metal-dependent hydrolase [Anaerolineae bacterium]|nr:metal-dependent hydrolase [Anaerolineae bacterium]